MLVLLFFKFFLYQDWTSSGVLDIYIPLSLLLFFIWVFELRVDIVDVYSLLFEGGSCRVGRLHT